MRVRIRLSGGKDNPTVRFRALPICEDLGRRGWDVGIWSGTEEADVIVLQWGAFDAQKASAKAPWVIFDCNDAVFLDELAWQGNAGDNLCFVDYFLGASPRITEHLERRFGKHRVSYIPDVVEPHWFDLHPQPHDGMRLIWTGMHDNLHLFEIMRPALEELARRRDFTLVIVTSTHGSDKKSNAERAASLPCPVDFYPWSPEAIRREVARADIGLAPLPANEWCTCKSPNKPAMFGAGLLPVVVSDIPSYRELTDDGKLGAIARDPGEWVTELEALMDDPERREREGHLLRERVRRLYSRERIADLWETALTELTEWHPH